MTICLPNHAAMPSPPSARALAYCRVSTVRQATHELSLDEQLKKINAFADLKDCEIVRVFVDRGASGRSENRLEFQKLIAFACDRSNAIQFVVVYNLSRFFRNTTSYLHFKRLLAQNGVTLVSATQDIPHGPAGELMETMLAAFDSHQSEANAATVRDMMIANAANGFWNGAPVPFGYRLVEASRTISKIRKKLEIDETEADTVRLIHRLCLEGSGSGAMGIKRIATHLNERSQLKRGRAWATSDIERILKLELYAGTAYYNRIDSRTRKLRPRDQWIEVATPAIIDRTTYGAVQETLSARAPAKIAPRLVSSPTLLTGLATCGCCEKNESVRAGLMLRTGKSGHYRYLVCVNRATKSTFLCDAPTLRMDALDEAVISALEQHVFTPERLRVLLTYMIAANQNDAEVIEAESSRLKVALSRAEGGLRALYRGAAAHGDAFDMADPVFRQELSELKARRASLLGQIEASENCRSAGVIELTDERIETFAAGAKQKLRDGDPQFRRTWLRHFVSEVIIGQQQITLRVRQEAVAACSTEVPSFDRKWRASQNKTTNTYVIEIMT